MAIASRAVFAPMNSTTIGPVACDAGPLIGIERPQSTPRVGCFPMKQQTVPRGPDGAGVVVSGLCAIHCLATPVLASSLPLIFGNDRLEVAFLIAAAAIALWSVARGCVRHHRRISPA